MLCVRWTIPASAPEQPNLTVRTAEPRSVLADGTSTHPYGNDRLARYQATMQYFAADGLGSVRQIYDATAVVVGSMRYDPYGNVMSQSGTATSVFAFAGEQQDATGLTYLRARYYSAQGRFTTRDEWEGDPNAPLSYNAWLYSSGNPVNLTDPTGHCDPSECPGWWSWWWQNYNPGTCPPTPTPKPAPAGSAGIAYITIDDGPGGGGATSKVLDVLDHYRAKGVKATFFLSCNNGYLRCQGGGAADVARMTAAGDAVGNHTWEHLEREWPSMSPEKQAKQMKLNDDELQKLIGNKAKYGLSTNLYRSPGGAPTYADISHYYSYYWTVDSDDRHHQEANDAGIVAENVLGRNLEKNLGRKPIILIHALHPSDPPALDLIIQGLIKKGYSFAPLPRPGDPMGVDRIGLGEQP